MEARDEIGNEADLHSRSAADRPNSAEAIMATEPIVQTPKLLEVSNRSDAAKKKKASHLRRNVTSDCSSGKKQLSILK